MAGQTDTPTTDVFTWPPKEAPTTTTKAPDPIQIRVPHPLIESIEVHLLGRSGLAFDQWALQTGWARDGAADYCWRCGGSIGGHEADGEGCADCRDKTLPWDRAIRLGSYNKVIRQEVLALKFAGWRPTGDGLGMHLGLAIREQLEHAQIDPENAVLVPIPMHRFRRVARGVDHTLVLARAAAKSSGSDVLPVLSTRWRPEQVGLSMTARARNIKDAFFFSKSGLRAMEKSMAQERRVYILIDDVRTTGATFVAAGKAFKSAIKRELRTNSDLDEHVEIWVACIGVASGHRRDVVDME